MLEEIKLLRVSESCGYKIAEIFYREEILCYVESWLNTRTMDILFAFDLFEYPYHDNMGNIKQDDCKCSIVGILSGGAKGLEIRSYTPDYYYVSGLDRCLPIDLMIDFYYESLGTNPQRVYIV